MQLLNSTDNVVTLENVGLSASGVYKCEVSGEAPAFQTAVQSSHMMVVGKSEGAVQHLFTVYCLDK